MTKRTSTKRKKRSQNITAESVETMVEIFDGWGERKLTWEAYLDEVALRLLVRYTRQTLSRYERIQSAFNLVKARQATSASEKAPSVPSRQNIAQDRIKRLEAEISRLKGENNRLLIQFVTWAYNAHTRGLDEEFLNRPVPQVNRGQSS